MNQGDSFFTSLGSLSVTILDALDLSHAQVQKSMWNKTNKTLYCSSAIISISHNNITVEGSHRTHFVDYKPNEVFVFNEEFVYESVPSTSTILVQLTGIQRIEGVVSTKCLGLVQIPLSRLEENTVVNKYSRLVKHSSLTLCNNNL
jgi:hypothetical protein